MNDLGLVRYAVTIGAAAAMLTGCGGSQPPLAPGAMPQSRTLAPPLSRHTTGPSYQVLYRFKSHGDGIRPAGNLIDVDGTLYGATTSGGGSSNGGTVYSLSTTGDEKILHKFGNGSDGAGPSGLIDVNGTLFGTTANGGSFGPQGGTFFSISTTGAEKVLHSFKRGTDGWAPAAAVINVNGTLYGTTDFGGSGCGSTGCGTVYRMSTTGSETVIYRFKGGSAGAFWPDGRLLYENGTLYGTTSLGGSRGCYYHNGCGTVFSMTTAGKENWLYSFGGSDGSYPEGRLVNVNGTLYGTTSTGGGQSAMGTVYTISVDGAEKVVHRFNVKPRFHAFDPETGLTDVKGTLYGTTAEGGASGGGTIYSISTTTGKVTILHDFGGASDGLLPQSPLLYVNGTLYGTTYYGGGGGKGTCCGTVFALKP